MVELIYDPLDPDVRADPYPYYAALRRDAPVHRVESCGMIAVSRYDDAHTVLKQPELYSSAPYGELIDAAMAMGGREALSGESLLGTDPPAHTRLRKIVNRAFTRKRVATLQARIGQIARELVDAFIERGSCDLVTEFAMPIPVMIIAEVIGIDPARRGDFKRWSDDMLLAVTGVLTPEQQESLGRSFDELYEYIDEVVDARRRRPKDDLISALIGAEGSDEVMTSSEVGNFINLVLVAGNEATTNLIGNTMLVMLEHPELQSAVRTEPALAAAIVDETLRYDSPVQLTLRRTTQSVELAGTKIAAGENLGVLIGSANRDERRFEHAELFLHDRERHPHLTFGYGAHFCLGAFLARLEATIGLQALVGRIDRVWREEGPIERPESWLVRGPKRLELRFEAAARLPAAMGS